MRFLTQIIEGIRARGARPGDRRARVDLRRRAAPEERRRRWRAEPISGGEPVFGLLTDDDMDRALNDGRALLTHLQRLGVKWICTTAGSPYYNPHVQRPAFFPPLDGYEPPEDPLRGVARQIEATAR